MRPKMAETSLCGPENRHTLSLSSLVHSLLPKDNLFKSIFDFITAGDWDYVAVVERLPALHCSVEFIFLSFGIINLIMKLRNFKRVTDEA